MQSVIELCIFLGWDGEGGESEKKKYSLLCLSHPFNLALLVI